MTEEEKKAIELLEEFIKYYEAEATSRKFRGTLSIRVDEDDIDALENLINMYKRVLKENEELKILKDDIQDKRIAYVDTPEFEENYVPVKKIKDKIEELKEEIEQLRIERDVTYDSGIYKLEVKREAVQELLEGRKI